MVQHHGDVIVQVKCVWNVITEEKYSFYRLKGNSASTSSNVKRCRDGMPKRDASKVGMMRESKGKAPSLHLFHTTDGQHA